MWLLWLLWLFYQILEYEKCFQCILLLGLKEAIFLLHSTSTCSEPLAPHPRARCHATAQHPLHIMPTTMSRSRWRCWYRLGFSWSLVDGETLTHSGTVPHGHLAIYLMLIVTSMAWTTKRLHPSATVAHRLSLYMHITLSLKKVMQI